MAFEMLSKIMFSNIFGAMIVYVVVCQRIDYVIKQLKKPLFI